MQTILTIIGVVNATVCFLVVMYCLYLAVLCRPRKKLDRSAWMYCSKCIVKWRPTAYGPPAPEDYYCPVCEERSNVKLLFGFLIKEVTRFEDGVRKQPPPERSN